MGKIMREWVLCRDCHDGFPYTRMGAGRPPEYCPDCRHTRQLAQSRERQAAWRQRRRAENVSPILELPPTLEERRRADSTIRRQQRDEYRATQRKAEMRKRTKSP